MTFTDETALTDLTVSNLRGDAPELPRGEFVRFRMPIRGGSAHERRLVEGPCKFPTINYEGYNGHQYEYASLTTTGRGDLPTGIATVRVDGPTVSEWSRPGLRPGEATFVPVPAATAEDDGVLLSLALDGVGAVGGSLSRRDHARRAGPCGTHKPCPPHLPRPVLSHVRSNAVDGVSPGPATTRPAHRVRPRGRTDAGSAVDGVLDGGRPAEYDRHAPRTGRAGFGPPQGDPCTLSRNGNS